MKAKLLNIACGLFLVCVIVAATIAGLAAIAPAQAAADDTPPCEPVAHAGALLISRCVLDDGTLIYANQVGFMVLGE